MSDYVLKNLKAPKNTAAGVGEYMLLAKVSDFEENGIQCPEAPFTNPGDRVTITTPHVFKADKAFAKVFLAPDKNKLDGKSIGDIGFNKFDITLEVFMPGSYAELHEFAQETMNTPLIGLVPDSNCDGGEKMYYQLGCDCVYARLTMDFQTETTKGNMKGYSGKLNYSGPGLRIYKPGAEPPVLGD
jgi:hypothetical protein